METNHNSKQNDQGKTSTDSFKMVGNWESQSKALQEKFPQLTQSDLHFEEGKTNELLARVEERLHKNREEVINIIRKGQPEKA